MRYYMHSNLSDRVLGVLACLTENMTCHQGARLLGTVSDYIAGRLDIHTLH